jgi:hypothetical protein
MVFDARGAYTNAAEVTGKEAMALTDIKVHVLPERYGFDLKTLTPILPGTATATAA